jgi:uncharacterized protein
MKSGSSILWRRLDQPGHEAARLFFQETAWRLTGTAVFAYNQHPCRLDYLVVCNAEWQTESVRVAGWIGNETVQLSLSADPARRWYLNGNVCPVVTGCLDIDLGFSPATNVLPIRRLSLAIGQEAEVRAAWLGFPSFTLESLDQRYHRTDIDTYHYESASGAFVSTLQVNATGFVTQYPGLWRIEE